MPGIQGKAYTIRYVPAPAYPVLRRVIDEARLVPSIWPGEFAEVQVVREHWERFGHAARRTTESFNRFGAAWRARPIRRPPVPAKASQRRHYQ